jgi:hypothetical protein
MSTDTDTDSTAAALEDRKLFLESLVGVHCAWISALHDYNEVKDAVQSMLGKLALLRGTSTKQLYKDYAIDIQD